MFHTSKREFEALQICCDDMRTLMQYYEGTQTLPVGAPPLPKHPVHDNEVVDLVEELKTIVDRFLTCVWTKHNIDC